MKNSIEVVSTIKFITVEFPIEVPSFKCTAQIQLVIGEKGKVLDKEYMEYFDCEFMGLPIDSFGKFQKKMKEEFGVSINKLIQDKVEEILTEDVCSTIIAENKF